MKKLLLLALCGLMLSNDDVTAQQHRQCGQEIVKNIMIARDPNNALLYMHGAEQIKAQTEVYEKNEAKFKTTAIPTIPVVFHVILTAAQKAAYGGDVEIRRRAYSQMDVINKDYNKQNADVSLVPAAFQGLIDNTQISFGLAHRKPDGTSTDGIEIVTTTAAGYDINNLAWEAKHNSQGGADAWDPSKYLNIWVVNLVNNGILGFTIVPFSPNPTAEDGVILSYKAFGVKTSGAQQFFTNIDKGRTLTHEIGHFFALEHIWGTSGSATCSDDDGIGDTPVQLSENYGSPSFPHVTCGNGPNGDMFMNYMDYVDDAAMHMFTPNQGSRMRAQVSGLGANSYSLTQHPEVLEWPTGVTELEQTSGLDVYPNPTTGSFQISFADPKDLQNITVMNMVGQSVKNIEVSNSSITNYRVDLTGMSKGIYLVQSTFAGGTLTRKIVLQ